MLCRVTERQRLPSYLSITYFNHNDCWFFFTPHKRNLWVGLKWLIAYSTSYFFNVFLIICTTTQIFAEHIFSKSSLCCLRSAREFNKWLIGDFFFLEMLTDQLNCSLVDNTHSLHLNVPAIESKLFKHWTKIDCNLSENTDSKNKDFSRIRSNLNVLKIGFQIFEHIRCSKLSKLEQK